MSEVDLKNERVSLEMAGKVKLGGEVSLSFLNEAHVVHKPICHMSPSRITDYSSIFTRTSFAQ